MLLVLAEQPAKTPSPLLELHIDCCEQAAEQAVAHAAVQVAALLAEADVQEQWTIAVAWGGSALALHWHTLNIQVHPHDA